MSLPVVIPCMAASRLFQGAELGTTDWVTIDQARIDRFAAATGDRRWIHVDPERAARESPWKSTVADGYLLLSLVPELLSRRLVLIGWSSAINIGVEGCVFHRVVTPGSRVRMGARIARARTLPPNGCRLRVDVWFEVEGRDEPCFEARVDYAYFE
jgi:acyl dehydratase